MGCRREPGGIRTRTGSRFRIVRRRFRQDSLLRERRPEGIPLPVSAFHAANIIGGSTGGVYVSAGSKACADLATVITRNHASTSDDDVFGNLDSC